MDDYISYISYIIGRRPCPRIVGRVQAEVGGGGLWQQASERAGKIWKNLVISSLGGCRLITNNKYFIRTFEKNGFGTSSEGSTQEYPASNPQQKESDQLVTRDFGNSLTN